MRAGIVLNSKASGLSSPEETAACVGRLFADRGIDADIVLAAPEEVGTSARAFLDRGIDAVVIGGGDGTVGAGAKVLAGTGVPLGILPLGNLNNFARDAGVPDDLEAAVDGIARGSPRPVDAAEVNGRVFVNNSSLGIYPLHVRERKRLERDGLPHGPAAAAAAFRFFSRLPLYRVRVDAGRDTRTVETPFVFVGNNRYRTTLLRLGRRDALDRGELGLFLLRCRTRWCFLRTLLQALAGFRGRRLDSAVAGEIRVETPLPEVAVSLDGEVVRLPPPLVYRTRPGALRVYCPHAGRDGGT